MFVVPDVARATRGRSQSAAPWTPGTSAISANTFSDSVSMIWTRSPRAM